MTNERLFKISIALWLSTLFVGTLISYLLEDTLPKPIRDYLVSQAQAEPTTIQLIAWSVLLVTLIVMLLATAKLHKLNIKGRTPFLVTNLIFLTVVPLTGPAIADEYSSVVGSISLALTGFIIAMSFTTSVLEKNDA